MGTLPPPPVFSVRRLPSTAPPSPLDLEVQAGHVHALVPDTWQARPLSGSSYPLEGFVASPHIQDWERGTATVGGTEAFWVDVSNIEIPSDYYYLVARGPALGSLATNKACHVTHRKVYLDDRPDFTGIHASPGDYVADVTGTCTTDGQTVRWEYVVIAPGYGPMRQVGIPTSGLYTVIAAVSGPRWRTLLPQMIASITFSNTSVSEMVTAARQLR